MIEFKETKIKAKAGPIIDINADEKCLICGTSGVVGESRFCLVCTSSAIKFDVPKEHQFEDAEFLLAPELADIGRKLIKTYDEFQAVAFAEITYLWKLKGGKTGGKSKLGACQKPSGLLKHFAETDFIVWVAADNCGHLTRYQITALVFHELKHAGYNPENGNYEIVPHDFEGFNSEVQIFGAWKGDVFAMSNAFKTASQPNLFE